MAVLEVQMEMALRREFKSILSITKKFQLIHVFRKAQWPRKTNTINSFNLANVDSNALSKNSLMSKLN